MIEKVARALAEAAGWDPDEIAPSYFVCGPNNECAPYWEAFVDEAIAAIKAMREPSAAMVDVFNEYHQRPYNTASTYRAEHTWKAMIDAALGEHK